MQDHGGRGGDELARGTGWHQSGESGGVHSGQRHVAARSIEGGQARQQPQPLRQRETAQPFTALDDEGDHAQPQQAEREDFRRSTRGWKPSGACLENIAHATSEDVPGPRGGDADRNTTMRRAEMPVGTSGGRERAKQTPPQHGGEGRAIDGRQAGDWRPPFGKEVAGADPSAISSAARGRGPPFGKGVADADPSVISRRRPGTTFWKGGGGRGPITTGRRPGTTLWKGGGGRGPKCVDVPSWAMLEQWHPTWSRHGSQADQ